MRLKKIKTHAEANLFLEKEYLPEHNGRFRRIPAQPEDYHRAAPRAAELENVFHLETGRILGNDWVVRHDNRYFQVQAQSRQYAPAKGRVTVCEWEDGRLQTQRLMPRQEPRLRRHQCCLCCAVHRSLGRRGLLTRCFAVSLVVNDSHLYRVAGKVKVHFVLLQTNRDTIVG
jgi:hypothetical protein